MLRPVSIMETCRPPSMVVFQSDTRFLFVRESITFGVARDRFPKGGWSMSFIELLKKTPFRHRCHLIYPPYSSLEAKVNFS